MDVLEAIRSRRSVKDFTARAIDREEIGTLLDAAVWAPNHRMTEPWRFIVLGDEAQRRYAEIRADRKARNAKNPDASELVREKVREQTLEIPRVLAVASHRADDPAVREEDYAATWMAIQNMLLAAAGRGLGSYIHTGTILEDESLRELVGVPADERVVALIDLGEPAEVPDAKPRDPAQEKTRWLQ